MRGETIFATSTGQTRSAIAIIRVSGPAALTAISTTCGLRPNARVATRADFRDPTSGALVDRGLVIWFPGPQSFTGEDSAEFHVHGGRAVTRAILRILGDIPGFRLAEAGEFTRRAFVAGKLDLIEAEGIAEVIAADTELQLRQAQGLAGGTFSILVDSWRKTLLTIMAMLESNIDFSDEGDVRDTIDSQVVSLSSRVLDEMNALLAGSKRGEIVRNGFVVVICGSPNAGKSSLLNAVARRDVSIVSSEAGTTRDLIEVCLDINGISVILVDTAGLRTGVGSVESEGISRARLRAAKADLAVWVCDVADWVDPPSDLIDSGQILLVGNKVDLLTSGFQEMGMICVSARTGFGLEELLLRISGFAEEATGNGSSILLTHDRHRFAIRLAIVELERLADHRDSVELMAEDVRRACLRLESLIGRLDVETVLGEIFSRFCIGK